MTPKSSEQNLKSTRLALRIQSILSSAHGDLIPSFASFIPQAVYFLSLFVLSLYFFCVSPYFFCVSPYFFCVFVLSVRSYVFLCVCSLFFISHPDQRLKPRGGRSVEASERRSFVGFSLFRSGAFPLLPAAMPHLQKSVFAMFAQLRRKQFSLPRQNTKPA